MRPAAAVPGHGPQSESIRHYIHRVPRKKFIVQIGFICESRNCVFE